MRSRFHLIFPTFVLTLVLWSSLLISHSAQAATEAPVPNLEDQAAPPEDIAVDPEKRNAVDIAPPPKARPRKYDQEFFYKYRNGLSPLAGIAYDTKVSGETPGIVSVLALRYLFASEALTAFEVGAELLSNGTGAIHGEKRFNYSRTKFRPYTTLGFGVRIVPEDQIATFLKREHYQVRAAAGFELLVWDPMSTRVEITVLANLQSAQAQSLLGFNYAW